MTYTIPTENFRHYINGELVEGKGRSCLVICPGTEERVAEIKLTDRSQALAALEAAQAAFPAWAALSLEQRGEWMLKLRDAIAAEAENILSLLLLESGKLRGHGAFETASLVNYLTFFLEQAKSDHDEGIRDVSGGKGFFMAVREPLGVVVAALAWNFPMHNLATKLGPVLASGCTAVIKPATRTPLSTMYLGEIMAKIGFPPGVINFVAGDAGEIGKTLCSSNIPRMLTMIGSTAGGLQMIQDSATSVKRFSMELGGNAPVLVTPSADLRAAVAHTVGNKMRCAGQTCVSPQRAFVHQDVYDEFLRMAVELGETAKCGTLDQEKDGANTGPMISVDAVKRMQSIVADAIKHGAQVECGGRVADETNKGYFFLPTILTDVSAEMRAFREEVFGPILTVTTYQDIEQAIVMANDTEYGLASYVWSNDLNEINRISRGLNFGIVNVNGPGTGPAYPHGGCKDSGIGKDGSRYSLEEYYYIKGMRVGLK